MTFFDLDNKKHAPEIITSDIIEVESEEIPSTNIDIINWEVIEQPIYNANGNIIKGYKQLIRNDNGQCLNICKDTYTHTPNRLFLSSVEYISQFTGFELKEIHELKSGKILLAYLQSPDIMICDHRHKKFMVVGNSHNGQSAFFLGEHNIMLRCSNQFNKIQQNLKAYHTTNNNQNINRLIAFFDRYKQAQTEFINKMQEFESYRIDNDTINKVVCNLLDIKKPLKELSARKVNTYNDLFNSIEIETNAIGRNLFGLFNGVTHYTTHIKREKQKIYSQFFGTTATMNNKTLQICNNFITI